ncbi:DnaJ domain-containing protein [Gilbertella persicaria]|uniref:DnaJ domain-containing protein n=1 Tax=Gilbertella persicaria TaxID=101096 RepID=UPI00221F67CC|nr:DnaJ domain-containing protein [Gilbertella persicaria]KAI8069800.1 DnaJ domain-containing protein [Gilbertella persicaria]
MEGNKDEALKCLSIAKSALETGNLSKAQKFAEKSIRLFPTRQGEQLLSAIKNNTKSSAPPHSAPKQEKKTPEPVQQDRKYTAEQLQAVKTILACGKNYYKVLSVERNATDIQIKKAYRKQALQFHPDKNSAPGADEAFKLVAKAFDVLSDSNKRAIHDQGGDADNNRARSTASSFYHQPQYAYSRRHGEEVSPEDLFNMFFGGGMRNNFGPGFRHQQQFRYRQQQQQQRYSRSHQNNNRQQRGGDDLLGGLSQFLPIILLFLLAIFAILFSFEGEPTYTFRPSVPNTNLRTTKFNHINYYVNPKVFDTTIKNNKYKFQRTERQIESDWLSELRHGCQQEQRRKANLLAQAEGIMFGIVGRDEKAYKKAQNMKMKNCDELRRLSRKIRS